MLKSSSSICRSSSFISRPGAPLQGEEDRWKGSEYSSVTHAHAHTHTHTPSQWTTTVRSAASLYSLYTHSHSHSCNSLTHTHTLTSVRWLHSPYTHSYSHTHILTYMYSYSHSLTLSHTHPHLSEMTPLSLLILTYSHTHTHTHHSYPHLSEMTPADRSSVACCPVGMCVSSSNLLRTLVRWLRFTSGKYFLQTSGRHAYSSPFHARRMEMYWPSLHSTSWRVDSNPADAYNNHRTEDASIKLM